MFMTCSLCGMKMSLTLQGHSVCRGIGIINTGTNIHLVLSEYFVSTCINECPGENVKSVAIIRGH